MIATRPMQPEPTISTNERRIAGVGDKLYHARIQAGLKLRHAAEALGIAQQTVSHHELNQCRPNIHQIKQYANLYGVPVEELMPPTPATRLRQAEWVSKASPLFMALSSANREHAIRFMEFLISEQEG